MWHHLARSRYLYHSLSRMLYDVLQVTCLMLPATGAVVAIRYGHPQPHIHKRIARRIMDQVWEKITWSNVTKHQPWLVGLYREWTYLVI